MEPEHLESEVEIQEPKQKSAFFRVTPFSKYVAMLLFIAMPFIGGWIGYTYAPEKVVEVEKIVEVEKVDEKPESAETDSTSFEYNETISSSTGNVSFSYPDNLITSAPIDCIDIPERLEKEMKHMFASEEELLFISQLEVGGKYGSFIYLGYDCVKIFEGSDWYWWGVSQAPQLYFVGDVEITGRDVFTEMAGLEYFMISKGSESHLPEFMINNKNYGYSSFKYTSDFDLLDKDVEWMDGLGYGPTTTLSINGIVYGFAGGGHEKFYGGIVPSVTDVKHLKKEPVITSDSELP